VTWRDGVHLTGTPIWCDARRRRDVCFLSSINAGNASAAGGDRVGRAGHGQLIGTSITLALLGARDKGHLAVPLRQRFTLGTVRLELLPSGRGFGAAALYADVTGRTVLYAGAVRTTAGGVGDPAELRPCDAVVVAAPYGEPGDRFPPLRAEIEAAIEWTRARLAAGTRPVLFVDSLLDGLEVASRLAAGGVAIAGPRALRDAAQRIADLVPSPQIVDGAIAIGSTITQRSVAPDPGSGVPAIAAPGREPRAIVWLDSDRAGIARSLGERSFATALVSARARAGIAGHDAGFVWAAAADRAQLLGWIEATGARGVYVTGACAEAIVAALGDRARVIGPPHQMSLFPHEAVS
jgi:putative mRNA 3-end processing factor